MALIEIITIIIAFIFILFTSYDVWRKKSSKIFAVSISHIFFPLLIRACDCSLYCELTLFSSGLYTHTQVCSMHLKFHPIKIVFTSFFNFNVNIRFSSLLILFLFRFLYIDFHSFSAVQLLLFWLLGGFSFDLC